MAKIDSSIIDDLYNIYGSGDALRDAKRYAEWVQTSCELLHEAIDSRGSAKLVYENLVHLEENIKNLNDHIDRMGDVQPLQSPIPYGSSARAQVATYIRRKSGGKLNLSMHADTFDIYLPEKAYQTFVASDEVFARCRTSLHNANTDHQQFIVAETDFATFVRRTHCDGVVPYVTKLYLAHHALATIGGAYWRKKNIDKAIEDFEKKDYLCGD